MDNKPFFSLSYGLYVVGSVFDGKTSACTVNTLAQATAEPVRLLVTVNNDNFTAKTIEKSGIFNATSFSQDAPLELIGKFGFQSSENVDKFAGESFQLDENNIPYLNKFVTARFSCRVIEKLTVGSHTIFVGEATDAQVLSDETPLTYAYYQTVKHGGTPKSAPSYKAPV